MSKIPIALQMYTLRREAETDYVGTLRTVAEIGYTGVELAGCYIPPAEIRKALDDLGLAAPSGHFPYDEIISNTHQTTDTALTLGLKYITCAGIPGEMRTSAEGFKRAGEAFAKAGEVYSQYGLSVCYHNHDFEFVQFDGKYANDILFASGDARYLKAQIDTYWVQFAGVDPAAYVLSYKGRCPHVHVKDMADNPERSFAEVGNGIMDWNAIFKSCQEAGVEWYIVEQDECFGVRPVDAVRTSFENLKKMGVA